LKQAGDQAAQKMKSLSSQIEEKEAQNVELRNKEKEANEELRKQGDKIDSLTG
jgi:Na+-translocating ferredoxin:NAD+ oxidoreductase RnfG subunit